MKKILEYSIIHFCEHILNFKLEPASNIDGELYGASIPIINQNKEEYNFYLFFHLETLNEFKNVLLNNAKMIEDDWCDLSKECANQIIGYAKNLLNDAKGDDEFKLGVPEYLGKINFSKIALDEELTFAIKGKSFRVGYKKNGK